MKKQAKQYSAEEKTKIVIEAIKGELTIAQITSKYGVHATQISNWKKQGLELLVQGFKSKAQSSDLRYFLKPRLLNQNLGLTRHQLKLHRWNCSLWNCRAKLHLLRLTLPQVVN